MSNDMKETENMSREELIAELKRLREQPRFTIDEWDKHGYCVTLYIDDCEYIGTLRLYKDEEGTVME